MSYNSLEDTGDAGIDERALKRRGDESWRKMEGLPNGNGDTANVGEHEEEPLNTCQRSSNRCAAAIGLRRVFPSHAETNFLSRATARNRPLTPILRIEPAPDPPRLTARVNPTIHGESPRPTPKVDRQGQP